MVELCLTVVDGVGIPMGPKYCDSNFQGGVTSGSAVPTESCISLYIEHESSGNGVTKKLCKTLIADKMLFGFMP